MGVDFLLESPTFAIATMRSLRGQWQHIPTPKVRDAICQGSPWWSKDVDQALEALRQCLQSREI